MFQRSESSRAAAKENNKEMLKGDFKPLNQQ